MDKNLAADMKVHAKVADCLDKNDELVEKYPRLKQIKGVFDMKRLRLAVLVAKKEAITTGITVDKVGAFGNYGDLLNKACQKAEVWAKANNNQALVAVFSITLAEFTRQTYAQRLETGKTIYAALSSNATELADEKVTDTDLAAIAAAIITCEAANIAPSTASTDKKTANESVNQVLMDIDDSMTTMGKLIFSEYSVTNPDFVSSYQNNLIVETVSVRHTGLSVVITDAATGKAIENAVLTIADLNKTATSNMAGLAEIIKMKSGSYHISIAANGYTTQLQDVTVPRSRVVDLAVLLTALETLQA